MQLLRGKTLHGAVLSGPGFLTMVRVYVDAVNRRAVPSVGDAWTAVVKSECEVGLPVTVTVTVTVCVIVRACASVRVREWVCECASVRVCKRLVRYVCAVSVGRVGSAGATCAMSFSPHYSVIRGGCVHVARLPPRRRGACTRVAWRRSAAPARCPWTPAWYRRCSPSPVPRP
jgi:hypothetical protein